MTCGALNVDKSCKLGIGETRISHHVSLTKAIAPHFAITQFQLSSVPQASILIRAVFGKAPAEVISKSLSNTPRHELKCAGPFTER
jgi:hypothetical protein